MSAVDITDFMYEYLNTESVNDMEQTIINNTKD